MRLSEPRRTGHSGTVWRRVSADCDGMSKHDRKEGGKPQTPHVETHFTSSEKIRDIVIGMSDGLTVPFALAAGLSGVVASTGLVITAGLAEVAAGAIAMGLGGFGYVKGTFTVKKPLRSAWQTAIVGGLAAAAAFGIAKLIA
jgi:VIT1/CCC1 family predicted Fe2+/Mn2+ transporter